MAKGFFMRVAGLLVEVRPLFDGVGRLCRDYAVGEDALNGEKPNIAVVVTPQSIERERNLSTEGNWSESYLETLAVLRAIAEAAPVYRRMLMHGAVLSYGGSAYMFCAPSGTGKSTHLRLWGKYLGAGAVHVVNGDKPLVELPAEGPAVAYGTPWCGKEGWQENTSAPLAGICFLERSEPGRSCIERLEPAEAIERALSQTFFTEDSAEGVALTLELLDVLLTRTPLWLLHADMSEEAVRASFETVTGLEYEAAKRRRFEEEA